MPIIIIPGAFTRPSSFDRLAKRLDAQVVARPTRRVAQLELGGLRSIARSLECAIRDAPDDGSPLVLIGHSMGGLLTLQASLVNRIDAQVLLMPAPPDGLLPDIGRLVVRDPVSALKFGVSSISSVPARRVPLSPPRGLFTRDASPQDLLNARIHRSSESWVALLQMLVGSREALAPADIPTLVVGGTQDGLVPAARVRDLARKLDADHLEFDVAHNFSEEAAGAVVDEAVAAWLQKRSLLGSEPAR